jgi:Flp pilus assembly protein TadD
MYAKWGAQRDALIDRVEPMLKGAAELLRDGKLGAAEARCREVLAVSPNDPWALNLLAQIQRITGRLQEAGRTQQLAVAVAPHDPTLTVNLGLLYRAQGEIDMARRCADRALVLDANFGPAIRLRAELAA